MAKTGKTQGIDPPRGTVRDLSSQIPEMTDGDLETLHGNAQRLAGTGNQRQRDAAAALLPSLTAELDKRLTAAALLEKPKRKRRAPAGMAGTAVNGEQS
jgi:hypothetical protein